VPYQNSGSQSAAETRGPRRRGREDVLASHHDSTGMRRHPPRCTQIAGAWLGAGRRAHPLPADGMAEHELLAAERHAALHEAFTRLSPCCQQLIALLIQGLPVRADQRRAGHPGREPWADPPPLPGAVAQRPGDRCLDQRQKPYRQEVTVPVGSSAVRTTG
jgi:hypothetical protein